MRMSKVLPRCSGYRLWLLGLGVCLLLLVAWSELPIGGTSRYSGKVYKQPIQRRRVPSKRPGDPPVFAYWIFGSEGDSERIWRLLKAVYHPRNHYLLHLASAASDHERTKLATRVQSERVFEVFGNVDVVGKSYAVNMMGASALAAMLHAAALLLKLNTDWDWFIALSRLDYPLVAQEDILHAFTVVPRDLNFVKYANNISLKGQQRINHIVVDNSLHLQNNGLIFDAVETRETPNAFKIYGGSPWMILSRGFLEHCVIGWDNLPRKLLMYFTNTADPLESYFHTVLCNSPEFQNTTVNHDLRYNFPDDTGAGRGPTELNMADYDKLISTGGIFARPFAENDAVQEKIDKNILDRQLNLLEIGKWCISRGRNDTSISRGDLCSTWDNIDTINPGSHGILVRRFLSQLTPERRLRSSQCSSNLV